MMRYIPSADMRHVQILQEICLYTKDDAPLYALGALFRR